MLNIIKAFAFAFSANIDNIAIGMSYGIKKIKIGSKINLIISTLMAVITYITMFIGKSISNLFDVTLIHKIGAYLLIIIGIYLLFKEFLSKIKENDNKDLSNLTIKNILIIVFTLSTNNIATGVAASMIGINIYLTFLFTFIFSFLLLYMGNKIGRNILNESIEKYSNILSAVILVILAIFQII